MDTHTLYSAVLNASALLYSAELSRTEQTSMSITHIFTTRLIILSKKWSVHIAWDWMWYPQSIKTLSIEKQDKKKKSGMEISHKTKRAFSNQCYLVWVPVLWLWFHTKNLHFTFIQGESPYSIKLGTYGVLQTSNDGTFAIQGGHTFPLSKPAARATIRQQ